MFEFKGTAAADASNDRQERDWRVADHFNIQQLGKRPFTTMLLPQTSLHQRSLTDDTKRPSLLQLRSRSHSSLANQIVCERTEHFLPLSVDRATPRTSIDRQSLSGRSVHTRAGVSDSFGKTLMAKGSKLLIRQNSKHNLTSLQTLEWLEETNRKAYVQEMSSRSCSRQSRIQSSGDGKHSTVSRTLGLQLTFTTDVSPRYNISEPFNFHHLTHTTPQHVQKIQDTNYNDLVSEFSAIRASQAPRRELRGIKANDIEQGAYVSEKQASVTSSPPRTGFGNSPPESPAREQSQRHSHDYSSTSPARRMSHSRSVENFSQPSRRYHSAQSSPTSPPPRTSSRNFAPDFFTSYHESPNNPTFHPPTASPESEPVDYTIATRNDAVYDSSLPHAVTTPDDTAHSIKPPPFSLIRTELAGVPEEDESSEGKRSSIATSIVRPTSPTSSVRHAKSFPSAKSSPPRRSVLKQMDEEDDEWLARPIIKPIGFATPRVDEHREEIPARPRASRRISLRREDSWEDVIDYCYEHEAEADCNFDWDLASTSEDPNNVHAETVDNLVESAGFGSHSAINRLADVSISPNHDLMAHRRSSSSYSSSPPSLLPLQTSLPDLLSPTMTSAESSFSSIPEAVTPSQYQEPALSTKTSDPNRQGWSASSNVAPLVMPDDSGAESSFDDMYTEMVTSHDTLEQQLPFPFHPARVDGSTISNSPRSSRSPISKSSSQESFWFSQANAAARRQRNAGSVGSLPELIQSISNEKSDVSTDQLAGHIALLNTSDAPGDGSQRRCSPSLAKDIALKSILSKVSTPEERDPLQIHPAFRDRACSDATSLSTEYAIPPPPQPKFVGRMRSTSSASSLSSRTGKRASYSLFPSPPVNKF